MGRELLNLLSGEILEDQADITLAELCRVCELTAEQIFELVDYGIIEPQGGQPSSWRFHGISVQQVRRVQRLERDLGVNLAGAALALDLLEELEQMRQRLHRIEK